VLTNRRETSTVADHVSATSTAPPATPAPSRVRSLDGLRGLAAASVVVGHVLLLLEGSRTPAAIEAAQWAMSSEGTPIYALWNGRGAVLLFFALSGYVLTLPFARPSAIDGGPSFGWDYFAKRWARIGVPYLVMTVVVMTASIGLSRLASQSTWPAIMFDRPPSIGDVIEWGTLIGLPNVSAFNSVVWTLVVEIRLSMLLPLVILAFRRYGVTPVLALTLLIAVVADLVAVSQPYEGSMAASISVAGTLHFLPLFAAGSALAFRRDRLTESSWLGHPGVLLSLLVVALTLYVRGHGWAVDAVGDTGGPSARPMLTEDYIVGAGAVLMVGLVAAGVGRGLLASRPLLALGRSSYSLYLWHLPVLVASALILTPHIGMMASAAVGLVVTVGVTWISYSYVEAPVQRLIRTRRRPADEPSSNADDVGSLVLPGPGRGVR
jgi:peptidoglycan/LPS O-acetylase OafA/YrhL